MKNFLIFVIAIIFVPLEAIGDEKYGSSYEAWQACDEFAAQYMKKNGVYVECDEDPQTDKILAFDEDTDKVLKRFKYDALVYGWVGKLGSNYEAWQACDEFADQYMKKNGVYVECEEDTPTKQILALDEDAEKVLKVFKY